MVRRRRGKQREHEAPPDKLSAAPGEVAEMAVREAPAMELHGGNWLAELPSDVGGGNRVTTREANVLPVAEDG